MGIRCRNIVTIRIMDITIVLIWSCNIMIVKAILRIGNKVTIQRIISIIKSTKITITEIMNLDMLMTQL